MIFIIHYSFIFFQVSSYSLFLGGYCRDVSILKRRSWAGLVSWPRSWCGSKAGCLAPAMEKRWLATLRQGVLKLFGRWRFFFFKNPVAIAILRTQSVSKRISGDLFLMILGQTIGSPARIGWLQCTASTDTLWRCLSSWILVPWTETQTKRLEERLTDKQTQPQPLKIEPQQDTRKPFVEDSRDMGCFCTLPWQEFLAPLETQSESHEWNSYLMIIFPIKWPNTGYMFHLHIQQKPRTLFWHRKGPPMFAGS